MPKLPKVNYDTEAMENAVKHVKENGASVRSAAKLFLFPKSSLQFRINNPDHKVTLGPNTILSEEEELTLVRNSTVAYLEQ